LPRFSENAQNSRFIVQNDGDFLSLSIRRKNDCSLSRIFDVKIIFFKSGTFYLYL